MNALTRERRARELEQAKANLRRAERAEAAANVARGGSVMDRPESEQLLKAQDRLRNAKRAVRWGL